MTGGTARARRRRSTATGSTRSARSGDMSVVDAATGKVFWKVNLLEKFGGSNIQWGLSESPLVLSDRILVSPGGRGASIVALSKTDGSVIWKSLDDEPGYSSAVLHEAGGIREAIYFTGGARARHRRADTGKLLWSYNQVANRTANIATPIVHGQLRVPLVRVRHRRRVARADARSEQASPPSRSISRATCATTTPARCSSATTCTASPMRS